MSMQNFNSELWLLRKEWVLTSHTNGSTVPYNTPCESSIFTFSFFVLMTLVWYKRSFLIISILAWVSNCMANNVWGEIIFPFHNFSGALLVYLHGQFCKHWRDLNHLNHQFMILLLKSFSIIFIREATLMDINEIGRYRYKRNSNSVTRVSASSCLHCKPTTDPFRCLMLWLISVAPSCLRSHNARYIMLKSHYDII